MAVLVLLALLGVTLHCRVSLEQQTQNPSRCGRCDVVHRSFSKAQVRVLVFKLLAVGKWICGWGRAACGSSSNAASGVAASSVTPAVHKRKQYICPHFCNRG
eukprot:103425-Pleurochrysis_carterae.AAC.6